MILLTPTSVVYFCQIILTTLTAVYLGWRSLQPVDSQRQLRLAAGVFVVTALLLAIQWADVSAVGPWHHYARFLNAPVLALQGIVIFLFLYHVPEWDPREKREVAILMVILVGARLLPEIFMAYQRFAWYAATGQALRLRPIWMDLLILAVVVWLLVVAVRRTRRLRNRSHLFLAEVILVCILALLMTATQVAFGAGGLSASARQFLLSVGAMVALPLLALIVLDMLSDPLTLFARLVGVVLVVTLFLVGGISLLLTPSFLSAAAPGGIGPTVEADAHTAQGAHILLQWIDVLAYPEPENLTAALSAPDDSPALADAALAQYLASRGLLHVPMRQLSLIALVSSMLVVVAVPVLLRRGLFGPLDALLAGVRQVNAGHLDVAVPVTMQDELGQVTAAFNRMVAELSSLVTDLEARVDQRTEELTHSEERYRELVEQIDEVIVRVTVPDLRIEYISPSVERSLGYPLATIMAPSFRVSDILHPDCVSWFEARWMELSQGVVAPEYEYKVIDAAGQERWIQQWNSAIHDNGRLIAIHGVCRDVTVSKRVDAQLRRQQSELAALHERERIGRDLHDGLGQVMGYVNVQSQAARTLIAAGQVSQAEAVLSQLTRIAQDAHADIRRYILDLRLPAGDVAPELWATALRDYLRTFSENYSIDVQLSYPPGLAPNPFAPAVGNEVLHIVQEALNNVRKYARVRSAQVVVFQSNGHIMVIVADNGAGFDPGDPAASSTTDGKFGLQIMAERAEAIGARLDVRSAPGAGTQVVVRAPAGDRPTAPAAPVLDEAVLGLRVLLVDDHPLFLDGMRNMLTARGMQVIGAAHDGDDAQELARQLHPDVILMDMNMPRCDGLAATAQIKAELPDIKIIILTVAADQEKLFQALQAGASGYLLKSLDSDEFFQLLHEAVHGEIVLSQGLAEQAMREFARRSAASPHDDLPTASPPQAADRLRGLSNRQRDILQRAAEGSTYKEIAAALFLSEATVKYHMGQIIELLQVENRREAIALARQAAIT